MNEETRLVRFPFFGVDMSNAPSEQRPGTAPLGINVRAYGTDGRKRGGSRAGLAPWFGRGNTDQVAGYHPIQSLSAIVTCDQGATFQSNFIIVNIDIHYSESDSPPPRDSPVTSNPITWYQETKPNPTLVTEPVVGAPDGGGTGRGTAKFKISTDGTTVTLVCTFISAGFPPVGADYFYSGNTKVFTMTQAASTFFNPSIGGLSSNWTVVSGPFIGNYFFNCYYPGP